MKLIVTLGSTPTKFEHFYNIDTEKYKEKFSFLALKKHFEIDDKDVVIIGTKETFKIQQEYIKNYKFVEVDADKFEEVFEKSLNEVDNNSILDLTQSFKSLGFGALLSYSFSKSIGKKVENIYYAQVQNGCNAFSESCEFIFQSLKKYEDIVDLVREINMFINSWFVLNQDEEDEFKVIHNNLVELSQKLFVNDLEVIENIENIEKEINRLITKKEYGYLHKHLEGLSKEIYKIKIPLQKDEYLKLIEFSKLYFDKNFLLQSLTTLFEGVSAFIEFKTKDEFECLNRDKIFTKKDNKYFFRNCLKSKLSVVRYNERIDFKVKNNINIQNLEKVAKHLVKIDELRNNSAHVFINGKDERDFKNIIKEELEFFSNLFKNKKEVQKVNNIKKINKNKSNKTKKNSQYVASGLGNTFKFIGF